jgi:hypothetical protein
MSRRPLTRHDLDAATLPGETALTLVQSCHGEAGLSVSYRDGVLLLRCVQCAAPVTLVAVADPPRIIS